MRNSKFLRFNGTVLLDINGRDKRRRQSKGTRVQMNHMVLFSPGLSVEIPVFSAATNILHQKFGNHEGFIQISIFS